jgi:hypothetical protein
MKAASVRFSEGGGRANLSATASVDVGCTYSIPVAASSLVTNSSIISQERMVVGLRFAVSHACSLGSSDESTVAIASFKVQ